MKAKPVQPKQLAVVTKVQPKPTKAEIIDALTQIEVERRNKERGDKVKQRQELGKELDAELLAFFFAEKKHSEADIHFGWKNQGKVNSVTIKFDLENLPSPIMKKLVLFHELPERYYECSFSDVRKDVVTLATGFDKETRVMRLLEVKETRDQLEQILDTISK